MPPRGFALHNRLEGVEQRHDVPHRGPVDRLGRPASQLGEQRQTDRVGPPLRIVHELQVQLGRPGVAVDPEPDALHAIKRGAVPGLLAIGELKR